MDVTITATAVDAQGHTSQASVVVTVGVDLYTDIYRGDF